MKETAILFVRADPAEHNAIDRMEDLRAVASRKGWNGPENLRTPYVRTVTKPEEERMLSVVMTAGQWQRLQSVLHQQLDENPLAVKEIQAVAAMDVQLREQTEPTEGLEIHLQ